MKVFAVVKETKQKMIMSKNINGEYFGFADKVYPEDSFVEITKEQFDNPELRGEKILNQESEGNA